MLLASCPILAQSGGGLMRPYGQMFAPRTAITFEQWVSQRLLAGRHLVVRTDNPYHALVGALQQRLPSLRVISPVQATNFRDTDRERPLVILIGSEVWQHGRYDGLNVYTSLGDDRVLTILLDGQGAETSLPVFLRNYRHVELSNERVASDILAAQIARAVGLSSDSNSTAGSSY